MRPVVSLLLIIGTSAPFQTDAGVPFNGLGGEALLREIARGSRPSALVGTEVIDIDFDDPFTGRSIRISGGELPAGYEWSTLVPEEWWRESARIYGDTVSRDLYNMIPLDTDVRQWRGSRPISEVVTVRYSNGLWKSGLGLMGGEEFECYWPPEALKGRLARTYFYMSTLYHVDVWAPEAYLMMNSDRWPGLDPYSSRMLMDWHRACPPGPDEIAVNDLARRMQGNSNPFVDYPDLAEYIWGSRQGETFLIEGEPKALRGTYRLSEGQIDLWSPYVASDAVWEADGVRVDGSSVSTTALGIGDHRLNYRSPSTGERGCLMIKITEG